MPVTFSFELDEAIHEAELVGSLIERLGWERLDASTYRYPPLGAERSGEAPEDWMNHVVPALMLFRSFVLSRRLTVRSYTLDANSSTGYRRDAEIGSPPLGAEYVRLYEPGRPPGAKRAHTNEERQTEEWAALRDWLDTANFPLGL